VADKSVDRESLLAVEECTLEEEDEEEKAAPELLPPTPGELG